MCDNGKACSAMEWDILLSTFVVDIFAVIFYVDGDRRMTFLSKVSGAQRNLYVKYW